MIKTDHGIIHTPDFFPTIGWPAGRGEYDRLFGMMNELADKINHYHYLFNFSSFAFGFSIPRNDFNPQFAHWQKKDIRDILKTDTRIDKGLAEKLIILLDIGGNRIFNKIVMDEKPPLSIESYSKYLNAYHDFIHFGNPDIFVNFDIGPSYSTRDEISKRGVQIWNSLNSSEKNLLNSQLLKKSLSFKHNNLIMVPISGVDISSFASRLNDFYSSYQDDVDIIGIAGLANQGLPHIKKIFETFNKFKKEKKWDVFAHGLGLGGWEKIPLIVKYEIDTCDVATPWRRACTDAISQPYIPLFDKNLDIMEYSDPYTTCEITDSIFSSLDCKCPFCTEFPLKEIKMRYFKADKRNSNNNQHSDDYYQMRVRIFFHNMYQHKALLKKLNIYREEDNDNFLFKFGKDIPNGKLKNNLLKYGCY